MPTLQSAGSPAPLLLFSLSPQKRAAARVALSLRLQFYDIPALSVRAAAHHLMAASVDKFKASRRRTDTTLPALYASSGTSPATSIARCSPHHLPNSGPCLQVHRITITNRQHLFIENGALRAGMIPVVSKSARSSVYFADQ